MFAIVGGLYTVLKDDAPIPEITQESKSVAVADASSMSSEPSSVSQESEKTTNEAATSTAKATSDNADTTSTEKNSAAENLDERSVVRRIRFENAAGEEHVLSEYVGEPIVLNIWASWCGPCVREMPLFADAMTKHDDIQFVMLNATGSNGIETKELADSFMAEHKFDFPIVYDYLNLTQLNLGVTMLPTTLFIDASGEIVYTQVGEISGNQLTELIDTYLN